MRRYFFALTPPQNINRVSESDKLASEIQQNNLKLNGLKAQIKDEKSFSRKNKLNRELRETQNKIWAAQERYDEINDVGQTWREKPLSSADEILNLLNEGIAQTQRKLDKFKNLATILRQQKTQCAWEVNFPN